MKISIFGWENKQLGQLPRIRAGFLELGHEIIEDGDCDFIYSHDSSVWDKSIEYKQKYPNSKLLLKVLDLPLHISNDLSKMEEQLKYADVVLANSQHVKKEIKEFLGLNSVVVYDVPHDIYPTNNTKKDIDYLMTGRLADPNKRAFLVKDLFNIYYDKYKTKIFVTCGSEYPGFGKNHLGIVTSEILNEIYNRTKIVFAFGKREGIGLQILESILAHVPVLTLSDCPTNFEFCPSQLICLPNIEEINRKIIDIEDNYVWYKNLVIDVSKEYKIKFSPKRVCQRIIEAYNNLL